MEIHHHTTIFQFLECSIRLLDPGELVVPQRQRKGLIDHPFFQGFILDRECQLHPAEKVAIHPVSGR